MVELYAVAFLYKQDTILLLRRKNAQFGDGMYSMVGGKVEAHETALMGIVREIHEEIGLDIKPEMLELVHTFHRKASGSELIALCFKADISGYGIPVNREPTKHDDLQFFDLKQLPINILPAHKQAILFIQEGKTYSEHGW